jgi:hypothetical protein
MLASRTNLMARFSLLFNSLHLALPLPSMVPEVETPPPFTEGGMKMETVFELRREAVEAVARQRRLRERLFPVRAQADGIEEQARQALASGEDLLARQLLARGLCTLETRRQLEAELDEARRRVSRLLATLVRAENRAWGLR